MKYLPFILVAIAFASCKKDKTDALVIGEYRVRVMDYNTTPVGTYYTPVDSNRLVTVNAHKPEWLTFADCNTAFEVQRINKNTTANSYYYESTTENEPQTHYILTYYTHTDSIVVTEYTQGGVSHGNGTIWAGHKVP